MVDENNPELAEEVAVQYGGVSALYSPSPVINYLYKQISLFIRIQFNVLYYFSLFQMPGGPFLFGALLAFIALLITLSLPEAAHKKIDLKKKTDMDSSDHLSDSSFQNQDLSPLLREDSLA